LSEIVELQNTGIAACFATLNEEGKFFLDSKLGENT